MSTPAQQDPAAPTPGHTHTPQAAQNPVATPAQTTQDAGDPLAHITTPAVTALREDVPRAVAVDRAEARRGRGRPSHGPVGHGGSSAPVPHSSAPSIGGLMSSAYRSVAGWFGSTSAAAAPAGAVPAAPTAAVPVAVTATDAPSFALAPERSHYAASAQRGVPVLARFVCPAATEDASKRAEERTPLSLVAVLDHSGSMRGSKIDSLRETMRFVVSQLAENDELAIVQFDSTAETLLEMTKMTDAGKRSATRAIDRLHDAGGTMISTGVTTGFSKFGDLNEKGRTPSMILLTDGLDGAGGGNALGAYQPLIDEARRRNVPIQCMGFGADHDSRLLTHLATSTSGVYAFIESPAAIAEAFAACVGMLVSCTTRDLQLVLEVPQPSGWVEDDGPTPADHADDPADAAATDAASATSHPAASTHRAYAGAAVISAVHSSYASTISADGHRASITFGLTSAGEKREAVVLLDLSALPPEVLAAMNAPVRHCPLRAHLEYTNVVDGRRISTPLPDCHILRVSDEQLAALPPGAITTNADVEVAAKREFAAAAMKTALELLGRDAHAKALAILDDAIGKLTASAAASHPVIADLIADLKSCKARAAAHDSSAYAVLSATTISTCQQRYTGSPLMPSAARYRNTTQTAMSAAATSAGIATRFAK